MNEVLRRCCVGLGLVVSLWPDAAHAQMHRHHAASANTIDHHVTRDAAHQHGATLHSHPRGDMAGMDMSGMEMGEMPMNGFYGPYPMTREASGTSWQPQ